MAIKLRTISVLILSSILFMSFDRANIRTPVMKGSLSGQIIDSKGIPLAETSLNLRGKYHQIGIISDKRGSFSVREIPVGVYHLSSSTSDSCLITPETIVVHLGKTTRARIVIRLDRPSVQSQGDRIFGPELSVDAKGRIIRQETIVEDKVFSMQYGYDENDNLISATDSMGNIWKYEYTESNNILKVARGDREPIYFNYDRNGNLWKVDLPRGYKIIYLRDGDKYIKRVTKYRNITLMEFKYTLDQKGRKRTAEEGTSRKTRLDYEYNEQDELVEIRNALTGDKRRFANLKTGQRGQYANNTHEYDNNNNLVRVRSDNHEAEVVREFDRKGLLMSEVYFVNSEPALGVEYLYDSHDRLVMKSLSHGIRYYYLRDKDGTVVHKIMRNVLSGIEVDNICFEPFLSDTDPDGFELVADGNLERLFVRDAEGNKRYLVDLIDVFNYRTHILQRGAYSDGESWGGVESILGSVLEMKKYPGTFVDTYLATFFDLPLANNMDKVDSADGVMMAASMGGCGCYSPGWYCPAQYSCCVDCWNGGIGSGGSDEGVGGGGGSDCYADVAGPMQLGKGDWGNFSVMTDCSSPYGFFWYGGLGPSMSSSTFSTYWNETGLKAVTVAFSTSAWIDSVKVVTSKAATAEVWVTNPPITVQIDTPTGTIWNISNAPSMPPVTFQATVNRDSLTKVNFRWRLVIHYLPFSPYYIPRSGGEALIKGADIWSPSWGGIITGGTMSVSVTAVDTEDGNEASAESYGYQIKGTNPTKTQVFAIASSLEAKGVFWQESKHKQFGTVTSPTPYTGTGYPLTNASSDWGIAQIHFYNFTNDRIVWNWSLNASEGISMLNQCYAKAVTYFDTWYHEDQKIGDTWPWDPHTQTNRVWDDAIARYHTGHPIYSPNGNKGVENCTWSAKAQEGCTYKNLVRNWMSTQPWTQF